MQDQDKTKEQLIDELQEMRQRVSVMEATEARLIGTEKALRESEEWFRLLYENAPLGYQSLDENGHFLEVNQAWLDTLGYDREDVMGKWFGDFLAPGYQEHFEINFPKFKAAGEIHWVEFEMLKKDGSQISVAFDGQIGRDVRGRFRQTHCILHDISEIKRSQNALKESEQRYRAVVDNVELGITLLNADMEIVEVNKAMKRYFPNVRPRCGQICYQEYNDPPNSEPCSYCPCVLTLRDGQVHEAITETPAGSEIRYYRLISSPIKDSSGRVQYVVELTEDITDKKRAEADRERSEKIYRQMFEGSRAVKLLIDPESGNLIDANPAAAQFYGYTIEDLKQLKITDINILPPEQTFAEMTKAKTMQKQHFFFKHRLESGKIRDVEVHSSPLDLDDKRFLYSIIHDVTDRKQAEEAADRANKDWERTFNAISDLVMVLDDQHKILRANKAMADAFGMTEQELMGKRCFELVHGEKEPPIFCPHSQLLADGEEHSAEVEEPRLGGIYDVRVSPLVGQNGRVIGSVHVTRDITHRKRAEEALQESEARVRMKLDSILLPDCDIGTLELADVFDKEAIQALMDEFFRLTNIGIGIIDVDGKILAATGWQDICTKFHRLHPETKRHCVDSDTQLSCGVEKGCFKLYRCKNSMWDIATPILVGGKHLGNLFLGQFLFEDETPDYEVFRSQARLYGFDEQQYLAALERVPRWSRDTVDTVMSFYTKLANILSTLSYSNIKLARSHTEQERLVKSLQESQERLELALQGADMGLWDWNIKTDKHISSERWAEMLGYTLDELESEGHSWEQLVHPDDLRPCQERMSKHLDGSDPSYEMEQRLRTKSGEWKWFLSRAKITERGEDGRPVRITGTLLDITERKKAEQAAQEHLRFQQTLMEAIPIPVFFKDSDGKYLGCNEPFAGLLGFPKMEIVGKSVYDLSPKRLADMYHARDLELISSGGSQTYESKVRYADGMEHDVIFYKSTFPDVNGDVAGLIGVVLDITDRKKAEEALKESEAKYRSLFDNAEVGMFRTRLDGSAILDMNEEFLKIFGRTREEMQSSPSVTHWADPHEREEMVRRLNTEGRVNDFECKMLNKKGEVRMCVTALRLYRDQGILEGSIMDVTERKLAEESLRAANSYNRSLIEASLDPLVTISAEGEITDVNTATELVTGYSRQELIGTDFAHYFPDAERARAGIQEAFKVGSVRDYELEILHKSGALTPVLYNASVYYDHVGNVAGLFAAARNIEKQKRAEQALRDSEERYRTVFHNAGIGIKVVNRDRRISQANPALLKMLGYSEARLLELTPGDITHLDDQGITNKYLDAILGDGPDSLRLQKRYIRKDGSVIWGDVSISAIRDARGNRIAALEVVADTTDRTKSQIALEESEKRMRRIIDSSPVGIRITQDGKHVYANRAFARMFGYESQEEILGLPTDALFAPESRALIRQRVADRMAGKPISHYYEASGITKHGKTVALESWGTEIGYLGKKSWLAFIIDISEAKSLRAQLLQAQKMEAVGTLAGGIAHDFNNILQVVLGFSEILLMDKREGDTGHEDTRKILSAAKKGADLVRGLLAFSRKAESNPKPLNLNQVIHQAEAILARTIPKTVKVDLKLQDPLSAISADPVQIEQILLNLAINARDAMPEGGTLTFETSNVSLDETYCREHLGAEAGDYVLLTISDTGEGMTKQTQEHIFEPFFSTKPAGAGTGLGLAMVYGIVKQHSGLITCYTEPGVGTIFKLYFPVMELKDEARIPQEIVRFPGGTETVLLVDDEDLVRELAKRILSRAGYTIITATNGREALQVYKKERKTISLIVLDLIMPEMDGKQCLRELLKLNPRAKVLVASGYSADGPTKEALEGGASGFVSKPFDMGHLLQTVRKVLDER